MCPTASTWQIFVCTVPKWTDITEHTSPKTENAATNPPVSSPVFEMWPIKFSWLFFTAVDPVAYADSKITDEMWLAFELTGKNGKSMTF